MMLTKNANPDKYRYGGYGIRFDARSQFLFSNGEWGKNIIFWVNNSSSMHAYRRKKKCLPTFKLDDSTITEEVKYSINIV